MEWTTKTNTFNYMVTQPDPDIPVASQKRIARAHKDTIEQVQWSSVELQEIQAADVWRQRQGIDKRLLHNCTAEAQGKHFILPFNADICAKCRDCHKEASKNSGISRFLNETCGGTLDVGAS